MRNLFKYWLLALLVTTMAIGPISAAQWSECGCSLPEPNYQSECGCETYSSPCDGCCTQFGEGSEDLSDCCGEEVTAETTRNDNQDPQPVPEKSQKAEPITPLKKNEPKPSVEPQTTPPVTTDMPAEHPAVPSQPDVTNQPESAPTHEAPVAQPKPEPPAVELSPAQPEADPLDTLFAPPATDSTPATDPSEPAKEAEPDDEDDPLEDLFSNTHYPDPLSIAGGLESNVTRAWTDNTAKFRCEARLLGISQGKIALAQASGKISLVPLRRLSDRDLDFVYQQVLAKREMLARQAEDAKLAGVWSE